MPRLLIGILIYLAGTGAWASNSALNGENLLQSTPAGYKLAASGRNGNVLFDEMIPDAEGVEQWTEMLTTQIFMGGINTDSPEAFYQRLKTAWKKACPAPSSELLKAGEENGYPMAVWMQGCAENPASGKPEYTWFKAIQGNDSFYLIQKAWRYQPSKQEVERWTRYLGTVAVCDTRLPAQDCKSLAR